MKSSSALPAICIYMLLVHPVWIKYLKWVIVHSCIHSILRMKVKIFCTVAALKSRNHSKVVSWWQYKWQHKGIRYQVERGRGENKRNRWVLQLLNNELIEIDAPTFNRNSYKYKFEAEGYCITGGKRFEVTQFYPIRFVIGRKLSTIRFIMHRLALDTTAEGHLIEHLCT